MDNFCNTYNHTNGYNGLKLGQRIKINDGTYNEDWYIAGFDMEHNRYASDNTLYNNGYGICLIPKSNLTEDKWYNSAVSGIAVPYIRSIIHTSTLPTIANNLKNVLGSHLINRNVLLSSGLDSSVESKEYGNCVNSYTWTTSYCTLMSLQQVSGFGMYTYNTSASGSHMINYDKYGIGEANYMLPLFSFDYFEPRYLIIYEPFYLRNMVYISTLDGYCVYVMDPIYIDQDDTRNTPDDVVSIGTISICDGSGYYAEYTSSGVRPMIYIR